MSDRQAISELLVRVRAATGPGRGLDPLIHEAAGLPFEMEYWAEYSTEQTRNLSKVPAYTSSLDAIVALIERELPGAMRASGSMEDGPFCRLLWPGAEHSYVGNYVDENATTEVLACCAAFLSAKLETMETNDDQR